MTAPRDNVPSIDPEPNKRSIYTPVIRDRPNPMLDSFDFPDPSLVTGRRDTTTIPSQSLFFLNDPLVIENAKTLAQDLLERDISDSERIDLAIRRVLSRPARTDELTTLRRFVSDGSITSWTSACQALLATAEFRHTP